MVVHPPFFFSCETQMIHVEIFEWGRLLLCWICSFPPSDIEVSLEINILLKIMVSEAEIWDFMVKNFCSEIWV